MVLHGLFHQIMRRRMQQRVPRHEYSSTLSTRRIVDLWLRQFFTITCSTGSTHSEDVPYLANASLAHKSIRDHNSDQALIEDEPSNNKRMRVDMQVSFPLETHGPMYASDRATEDSPVPSLPGKLLSPSPAYMFPAMCPICAFSFLLDIGCRTSDLRTSSSCSSQGMSAHSTYCNAGDDGILFQEIISVAI
jgi:hypothetical protein